MSIALVIGISILAILIIFGLSKLFRSVKCPHCGLEFFTGNINSKIKCPKCNTEFSVSEREVNKNQ